jgi:hypothetical protein
MHLPPTQGMPRHPLRPRAVCSPLVPYLIDPDDRVLRQSPRLLLFQHCL